MIFLPLLSLALPVFAESSSSTSRRRHHAKIQRNVDGESHQLAKRETFSGRATFYDVGLGACGWNNVASDFIVAQNSAQYGGGYPGPNCGKSITISYNGITATATIADECPTCPYGGLDMSRGLFDHFASESLGTFQMTWWYNDGSGSSDPTTTTTQQAATTTSATPPSTSSETPTSTSTSTSSTAAGSSISSSSQSSSSSTSLAPSASASLIPDATTNKTVSGTAAPGSQPTYADPELGNLVLMNQAVAYLGHIVVVGATV